MFNDSMTGFQPVRKGLSPLRSSNICFDSLIGKTPGMNPGDVVRNHNRSTK